MPAETYRHVVEEDLDSLKAKIQFAASYKENWQNLISLFEQISVQNSVFIMIWNVITNRIIYVVDKKGVVGHDTSKFLAANWFEFSFSNMHPKFAHATTIMQQEGNKYFIEESKGDPEKFVMCLDLEYKKSSGEYFHVLQQSVCVEKDSVGNPFLLLSYVHNITYLKKRETANFIITTPDNLKWWNFNFDKNCLEPVQPLSKQEKKILSLLAEGKSSKEIANELFVSSHTIDTHRRNLLEKTNCIDTTGMITYCKLVGLL